METYYHPHDLPKFGDMGKEAPELWKKFLEWYNAVFQDGALTEREKALIALAVAHAVQCPYCIDAYSTASLEKGSTPEQMTEAVHVAALVTVAVRVQGPGWDGVQLKLHGPVPVTTASKGGAGVVPVAGTASTRRCV